MKEAHRKLMEFCSGKCPPELSKYECGVGDAVYVFLATQYDRWAEGDSVSALLRQFFAAIQRMSSADNNDSAAAEKEGNHEV